MSKPEYKLFPCIFCTIGFNCYVAGHKLVNATYHKVVHDKEATPITTLQNTTDNSDQLMPKPTQKEA